MRPSESMNTAKFQGDGGGTDLESSSKIVLTSELIDTALNSRGRRGTGLEN